MHSNKKYWCLIGYKKKTFEQKYINVQRVYKNKRDIRKIYILMGMMFFYAKRCLNMLKDSTPYLGQEEGVQ